MDGCRIENSLFGGFDDHRLSMILTARANTFLGTGDS